MPLITSYKQSSASCQWPLFIIIMNTTIGQSAPDSPMTIGFLCYVIMKMNFLKEVKPLLKGQTMISGYKEASAYDGTWEKQKPRISCSPGFAASFFLHIAFITCFLLFPCSLLFAAEIKGPEVRIQGNEIQVTTSLSLDDKYLNELKNGIKKEFHFYIDIFRVWNMWPDEFILSKSFTRTLRSDPVKTEFIATSSDGTTQIKKRFKSFESMLTWTLSIDDLKLANIRDLEPGTFFVRVTVESKIRQFPPVIGYFMIFLPENEFKIKKDSLLFSIGTR